MGFEFTRRELFDAVSATRGMCRCGKRLADFVVLCGGGYGSGIVFTCAGCTLETYGPRQLYARGEGDGWRFGHLDDAFRAAYRAVLATDPDWVPPLAGESEAAWHAIETLCADESLVDQRDGDLGPLLMWACWSRCQPVTVEQVARAWRNILTIEDSRGLPPVGRAGRHRLSRDLLLAWAARSG